MSHHLIFEVAELAGKSWVMSQIYTYLEKKDNKSGLILDGCHWLNCDVGIYGTKYGRGVIGDYINIFKKLKNSNIIVEKLHLSDKVYNQMHRGVRLSYFKEEEMLKKLNFKIILIKFPEDKDVINKRIQDRLNLYPHYKNILQKPEWYIDQQNQYNDAIAKTSLPFLEIETNELPSNKYKVKIINWLKNYDK